MTVTFAGLCIFLYINSEGSRNTYNNEVTSISDLYNIVFFQLLRGANIHARAERLKQFRFIESILPSLTKNNQRSSVKALLSWPRVHLNR